MESGGHYWGGGVQITTRPVSLAAVSHMYTMIFVAMPDDFSLVRMVNEPTKDEHVLFLTPYLLFQLQIN